MIKSILLFLFIIPVVAVGQNRFSLNVTVPKSFNDYKVYLEQKENDIRFRKTISTNVTTVKNGHFSFSGSMDQPCRKANLILKSDKPSSVEFIIDSGTYNAKIELSKFVGMLKISVPHSASNRIKEQLDSMQAKFYEDYKKANKLSGSFGLSLEANYAFENLHMAILKQHPHDYYSLLNLYDLSMFVSMLGRNEAMLTVLNSFDENIRKMPLALQIYKDQAEKIKIRKSAKEGKTVPVFNIRTFDDKPFTNDSLKGQPYIIAFSATWCIPCQEKLPVLKALYKKYKDRGLKVIYFNEDDNMEVWRQHIAKDTLTWINVSERIKHRGIISEKLFNVHFIPAYLLIDRNGIMVYNSEQSDPGMDHLDASVARLFN